MAKKISIIAAVLFLLISCEKEIQLDYRSIDPLYVVEGRVNDEALEVKVSQTRDMETKEAGSPVEDATVVVTPAGGSATSLQYESDGYYRSDELPKGVVGTTYSLAVTVDDQTFSSSSFMNGAAEIADFQFLWLDMLNDKFLFCRFSVEDRPGEENYYYYRVYRNGALYKWDVFDDRGLDGELVLEDFLCTSKSQIDANKEEDWDEILYEGDEIEVELQSIDRLSYDYLYSLGLSQGSSANPIANFTGGCLGYFSAYSISRKQVVFSYSDVQ